jgi:AcrR family transcriptional regulator
MERILAAAQDAIAEHGAAALTIADVATRAGVAVGTIYGRFAGKDALITAVQQRWLKQSIARQEALPTGAHIEAAGFDELVAANVTTMIETFCENADLIREFAIRTTATTGGPARRTLHEGFTRLCDALMAHPDRPPHIGRPQVALALRAVQSTLEWRVSTSSADAPDNDWDALGAELPRLAARYMAIGTP